MFMTVTINWKDQMLKSFYLGDDSCFRIGWNRPCIVMIMALMMTVRKTINNGDIWKLQGHPERMTKVNHLAEVFIFTKF